MEFPVVNHPDYVAKINDDNKFPIKKFGALAKYLLDQGVTGLSVAFSKEYEIQIRPRSGLAAKNSISVLKTNLLSL